MQLHRLHLLTLIIAVSPLIASSAFADDTPTVTDDYLQNDYLQSANPDYLPKKQYVISAGIGGQYKPKYPGADEYGVSPFGIIDVRRFYVPGIGQVVDGTEKQVEVGLYPSFSFIGERDPSDSDDLTGTESIDWALELGLGAYYRRDWFRGFAEIRQGFNGHTGQVGTLGFNIIGDLTERTSFEIGPRVRWASNEYMDTYFGVTSSEAAAPGARLKAYDPDSGIQSVGIYGRTDYAWTDKTTLHFRAGWERFVGDAADSPIIKTGDEDQFSVGAGISYRFDFDLFQ